MATDGTSTASASTAGTSTGRTATARPTTPKPPPTPVPAPGRSRLLLPAVGLLVLSLTAFAALAAYHHFPMADVYVYRAEGAAVLHGRDLYGFTVTRWRLPATYPPFAALLFTPAAAVPLAVAKAAFAVGNVCLLAVLVHLSLRAAGRPAGRAHLPLVLAATAGGLWLEPVFQTLVFGQINLALACLVLWDLNRPDGARGKGLLVGVAAGVKLTPAIFAVYLLLTGRRREAATAAAGFAGTVALGALFLPAATVEFFTYRVLQTGRVGKAWIVDNQSLQGLLARAAHIPEPGPGWLLPALAVACCGLWLARRTYLRRPSGGDLWGVLLTAFTALLVSPISWSHHWVWCVPLVVVLAVRGPRWRTGAAVAVAVVFTARSLWLVPKEGDGDLHLAWWLQPLGSPYPLLALALLAAATVLPRRRAVPLPAPRRAAAPLRGTR